MTLKIYGQGNPLLDISAEVSTDLLTKYDLKAANAILAEEKHVPLYEELSALPGVQYIPGGATLNSIRVANWMLEEPGLCSYVGCVGKDKYGTTMTEKCTAEGLAVPFMVTEEQPTGTCGVLVTGIERSLVANLAAANLFKDEHFGECAEAKACLEGADIIYSAGFFLTVSVPSIVRAGKHCLENKKTMCLNLSAPFIVQFFGTQLAEVMPYVDILFSNDDEAKEYAKANNLGTEDVAEIAKKCVELPKEGDRPRTVVFTCGKEATIVATKEGVKSYPVATLDQSKIVDTNGAGDAFVGGFLAYLAKGKDMEACVLAGHYSAGVIIQHSGCTFPEKPEYSG
jgi:adenosine kinase